MKRIQTRNLLRDTAIQIMTQKKFPSITEIAEISGVSRATAYRYYPSQEELILDIISICLDPLIDWQNDEEDIFIRTQLFLNFAYKRLAKYEGIMRVALKHYLEATSNIDHPKTHQHRKERRKKIVDNLLSPLKKDLDEATYNKITQAYSIIFSVEALFILKDWWDVKNKDIPLITGWIGEAIIKQALSETNKKEPE